ncbi:MAG TPA: glycosyltransferase family 39 protein [Thermoleophilaceae bacterium]|nr:glycosyltransferase family 39 protein [Thermoleophilaceae bacterium]
MSRSALALVALTVVGAALRFATLDLQSFDFDEAITVGPVLGGSFDSMLDAIPRTESTPPLYYALAWLWTQVFGLGEVGVRSLSALFGTVLVPVAYGAARELAGRRAGLVAAALVAVNPQLIFYSQEARAYSLLALLAALSFWAFLVARRDTGTRSLVLWALVSVAALLTHYFAAFVVVPEAIWLVAVRRPRLPAALAAAAVGAVGVALVPLASRQSDGRTDWISDLPLGERLRGVVKSSLTGEYDPTSNWQIGLLGLVVLVALAVALRRAGERERRGVALALGLGALGLAIPLAIDLTARDLLTSKNVIFTIPLFAIGVGAALGTRDAGRLGAAVAALVCAACLAIFVITESDPGLQRPDYRGIAETLGHPGASVGVLTPYLGSQPLARYVPGAAIAGPAGAPVSELDVVQPLGRSDVDEPARPATPPPPPGFVLHAREDHSTFTRIRYSAPKPVAVNAAGLAPLLPATPSFPPQLMVWPRG